MLASRETRVPDVRVRTPAATASRLRAHLERHNLQVVALAASTFLASIGAWFLLYVVSTWVVVIAIAFFDLPYTHIPRGYTIVFAVAALCAIIYTWIDNRLTPNDRVRDEKNPGEIVSEFILAIPRMTLSVGGTLAAWQQWKASDFQQAATLLHRLAEGKRLPMSSVRLDIPDPAAAMRILFGLQITQVIEVQREDQEFWLKLSALRPASLRFGHEVYADA